MEAVETLKPLTITISVLKIVLLHHMPEHAVVGDHPGIQIAHHDRNVTFFPGHESNLRME